MIIHIGSEVCLGERISLDAVRSRCFLKLIFRLLRVMRLHEGISPLKFYSISGCDLLLERLRHRQLSLQRIPTLSPLLYGLSCNLSLLRTLVVFHGLLDRSSGR